MPKFVYIAQSSLVTYNLHFLEQTEHFHLGDPLASQA